MLYGEGSLFWLIVRVQGTTGITSPLNLREFIPGVGGSVLYAPEDLSSPIPLRLQNGVFHVGNACTLGDLNGNGVVEAVDAYIALQIARGRLTPTPEQSQCGDVNGNGRIAQRYCRARLQTSALQQTIVPTDGRVSIAEYSTYLPIIMRP